MLFETTLKAELLVRSALKAVAAIPFRLTPDSKCFVADEQCRKPCAIPPRGFCPEIKGFSAYRNT